MRQASTLLEDQYHQIGRKLEDELQDPQSPLNVKFRVSIISFYYQFYIAFLVILYSLIQLALTWSIFDQNLLILSFKTYPILVFLLFLSIWNKKQANIFTRRIPIVCIEGYVLSLTFLFQEKNLFDQFLDYTLLISFITLIIFCPTIQEFRKTKQFKRIRWSLSFLFLLLRFKFYPELSKGSNIISLQFLFACQLLAALTDISRHRIINLKKDKQKFKQFLRQQIFHSHLFKIIFLPHYTNVSSFLLIGLIVITVLQIKFLITQKNAYIIDDFVKTGTLAIKILPNRIFFFKFQTQQSLPIMKALQKNKENNFEDQLCSICLIQPIDFALWGCKHLVYCQICIKKIYKKFLMINRNQIRNIMCPICKKIVKCQTFIEIINIHQFLENKIDLNGRQAGKNYFSFKEIPGLS